VLGSFHFFSKATESSSLCSYVRTGSVLDFEKKLVLEKTDLVLNIYIYIL